MRQSAATLVNGLAIVRVLAPASGLATWASPIAAMEPCTAAESCRDTLRLGSGTVTYYRSVPLTRNEAVRRAVIVVHGNRRDGDRYFDRLVSAATAEERLRDTALLAPHFRTRKDNPAPGEHYWSSHGWKIGHRSLDAARVSSFAVIDALLDLVCSESREVFPNLETVVLIGHSAGGQFVARYVAGGRGCADRAVKVRYVVMNPSSYLYVDGRRRSAATKFEVPSRPACSDY